MNYKFLNNSIDIKNNILPKSSKIDSFLLDNNQSEIAKGLEFLSSEDKLLHVHGFLGTGKRQYINYISEFLPQDAIKLEYYCKESTVCDDILLSFIDTIEKSPYSKITNLNTKITTLNLKFQRQITSIKKPFIIILHSFDAIEEFNIDIIVNLLLSIFRESNVKFIISTKAMKPPFIEKFDNCKKVFLKAFTKEIFKKFLNSHKINATDAVYDDFYKYTRGYYYYTYLSVKIIEAMKISLNEFLQKFNQLDTTFDSFLSITYLNLIPTTIRNFFWFLRTLRHGISLNALASLEIYDEFSIEYLKNNLMIFQADEILYIQDFFLQEIDISIPKKVELKLHNYIIKVYEEQLKTSLDTRILFISRQAMRSEIEYHTRRIELIENKNKDNKTKKNQEQPTVDISKIQENEDVSISSKINQAQRLINEKKYTQAIEMLEKLIKTEDLDIENLITMRLKLARSYKDINDYNTAYYYYELIEAYYIKQKETINLNYLYYELADVYYDAYKPERAIEIIKKVIYSVDTPQALLINACMLLGNIYSDIKNTEEACVYYEKAIDSIDENTKDEILAELYFKYALANDDKDNETISFEYYNKCLSITYNNIYKPLVYSNMGSRYFDNDNYDDALFCFQKAYNLEKENNNFEGIYYTSSYLAKLYARLDTNKTLDFLLEAKKNAEFINDDYCILESMLALGDFYYNKTDTLKKCLIEYIKALNLAEKLSLGNDIMKIKKRIEDMKLRISSEDFTDIENKYGKNN